MSENVKITLIKSTIGSKPNQKLNIEALGLKKVNSTVVKKDNPATRGMINKVKHLVSVTEN